MSRLAAKIVAVTNVSKGAWEDVDIIEEIKPLEFSEGKNSSITFDFGFEVLLTRIQLKFACDTPPPKSISILAHRAGGWKSCYTLNCNCTKPGNWETFFIIGSASSPANESDVELIGNVVPIDEHILSSCISFHFNSAFLKIHGVRY